MSLSAAAKVLAVAAVFIAAPAIADNARWAPAQQPGWGGFYAATPLDECRRSAGGELELRACLSRLLLEAESHYDITYQRLISMVTGREDSFQRATEAEALRFARETWRSYLDFQCDFEGAMLGQTYAERNLQATSCRVSLLRSQRARLAELAGQIDAGFTQPGFPANPGQWRPSVSSNGPPAAAAAGCAVPIPRRAGMTGPITGWSCAPAPRVRAMTSSSRPISTRWMARAPFRYGSTGATRSCSGPRPTTRPTRRVRSCCLIRSPPPA